MKKPYDPKKAHKHRNVPWHDHLQLYRGGSGNKFIKRELTRQERRRRKDLEVDSTEVKSPSSLGWELL